jgi:hypothetical protein
MFNKESEAAPSPAEEAEECLVLSAESLAAILNAKVEAAQASTQLLVLASRMETLEWQYKHAQLEKQAASAKLVEAGTKQQACYVQALESVGITEHGKWDIDLSSGEVSPKSD